MKMIQEGLIDFNIDPTLEGVCKSCRAVFEAEASEVSLQNHRLSSELGPQGKEVIVEYFKISNLDCTFCGQKGHVVFDYDVLVRRGCNPIFKPLS
jgi:predicted metal-binding protein